MATMVVVGHNPQLARFYAALLAAGKPKKLALTAAMRKLLTVLKALHRDGTPWRTPPIRLTCQDSRRRLLSLTPFLLRPQHQAETVGVVIGLVGEEPDRDELAELDRPALDVLDWPYRQRERARRPPPLTEEEAP